jgi:hypothetical protein
MTTIVSESQTFSLGLGCDFLVSFIVPSLSLDNARVAGTAQFVIWPLTVRHGCRSAPRTEPHLPGDFRKRVNGKYPERSFFGGVKFAGLQMLLCFFKRLQ